ncbi:MAG: L,D-transpeptidase [Hyphomicrobium sp.]|jgi:lipoprotein-anchoring transpeptidase ErfK/SrfK
MSALSKVRDLLAIFCVAAGVVASPGAASAQGVIDFLWGGEADFGGKRQVVGFSKEFKPGQIIVSFGDRRLYLIDKAGQAISYPIAVPREQSRWEGMTTVSAKRENPAWTPTPDMFKENPRLPSWVPGGHPMNPLGVRALYLGSSTYRIHGTDAPWTIGQAVSKGCIRMFNEDVLDLYPRVPTGTKVLVTWNRYKTDGSIEIASAPSPGERSSTASSSALSPYGATASYGASSRSPAVAASSSDAEPYETATKTKSAAASDKRPKEGFFIYPDDDANPPRPEPGMVTKFSRKVGAGAVAKSAQTAQVN